MGRLSLLWTVATILGAAIGLATMFAGVGVLVRHAPPALFGAVLGGVVGLGSAVGQWLVLRRRLTGTILAPSWISATMAAWVAFWAMNMAGALGRGSGVTGKVVEGLAHGALFGAMLGFAQGWALRETVRPVWRWALASAIVWAIAAALGDGVKAATGAGGPIDLIVGLSIGALLTGLALEAVLQRSAASRATAVRDTVSLG